MVRGTHIDSICLCMTENLPQEQESIRGTIIRKWGEVDAWDKRYV